MSLIEPEVDYFHFSMIWAFRTGVCDLLSIYVQAKSEILRELFPLFQGHSPGKNALGDSDRVVSCCMKKK